MRIVFKKIGIKNFLSIGPYVEIDLLNRGYTLIEGRNNNPEDNAFSNGAGKTTIIDAIVYALTGNTTRGINKNLVNIHTDGGMLVKLEFDVDGKEYMILRAKDDETYHNNILFYINEQNAGGKGINETKKAIQDALPELTESLITSVIVLGQGMPNRFTNNTPSGRKEILEKLSHSDFMIEDIKNRLSNRKSALNTKLSDLKIERSGFDGQLKIYVNQLEQYKVKLESLSPVDKIEIEKIQYDVERLKVELTPIAEQYNKYNEELRGLNNELSQLYLAKANDIKAVEDKYNPQTQQIRDSISEINASIKSLGNEIIRLKSVKDICPTCGQKLPNVHKVDTTDKENEQRELQTKLDILIIEQDGVNKKYTEEKLAVENSYIFRENQIRESINTLNNTTIPVCHAEMMKYEIDIREQEMKVSHLQQIFDTYQQTVDDLNNSISVVESHIAELNNTIDRNTKEDTKTQQRLDIVSKMTTIATRDFRGFLLTNVIEYLNKRAKIYCEDIFGTTKMEFQLDDNNLNVIYDDKLYENLSGGEQKRIDIICQLSIRDMLCQFSNFSSNMLILDEFTDSLDKTSVKAVVDCITNRLSDVDSTFIITHMADFPMTPNSVITVVKDAEGISQIMQ